MLKEFSISNFRSFKDEFHFTMEASDDVSEMKNHIIKSNIDNKILKVASIYGPNAGGKSNLLQAAYFLKKLFQERQYRSNRGLNNISTRIIPYNIQPFLFSEQDSKVIEYSVFYINDYYELGYQISIDVGVDGLFEGIKKEVLNYREINSTERKEVFSRESNKINSVIILAELKMKEFVISDDLPFVQYLYENHVNKMKEKSFGMSLIEMFFNEINSIFQLNITKLLSTNDLSFLLENMNMKAKTIEMLNKLDIPISDIIVEKDKDNKENEIICVYKIGNISKKLNIRDESAGTRSLLRLLPRIISTIEEGGILIVDDLDLHLHPKLISKIIQLFNSDYNQKAQLIFTSHDILNMSSDNFRRDEIWFVYRNEQLSSEVVCLSDFVNYKNEKVRKDAKYSKQYMEGKYGADPFITKDLN